VGDAYLYIHVRYGRGVTPMRQYLLMSISVFMFKAFVERYLCFC
jgi:hypothetical protein